MPGAAWHAEHMKQSMTPSGVEHPVRMHERQDQARMKQSMTPSGVEHARQNVVTAARVEDEAINDALGR